MSATGHTNMYRVRAQVTFEIAAADAEQARLYVLSHPELWDGTVNAVTSVEPLSDDPTGGAP